MGKSGPASTRDSVEGSSTRSNGRRTIPTTSVSPASTCSNDSVERSAIIRERVPTSKPYCSAARSLTTISSALPGDG